MLAARFMEHYNAGVERHCPAMANAAATLAELQRRGWQQAVLSASRRDYLIEQVRARGLEDYFTELLGLQDIYGVSKVQVGKDWPGTAGVDPAHLRDGGRYHPRCRSGGSAIGDKMRPLHQRASVPRPAGGRAPHVIDDISQLLRGAGNPLKTEAKTDSVRALQRVTGAVLFWMRQRDADGNDFTESSFKTPEKQGSLRFDGSCWFGVSYICMLCAFPGRRRPDF